MTRHPIDRPKRRRGTARARWYGRIAKRHRVSPALRRLRQRARPQSGTRLRAFLKVLRGAV